MTASIQIFDTLRQRKVPLVPIQPGEVSMYVCGPTVYDLFHLGNARPLVVFDVVSRHLRSRGYQVKFARNITDVDDKIIARAAELGEDPADFAARWAAEYRADYAALGCVTPDVEPLATQHIPEMVAQIQVLLEKGHAYESRGSVYMAARSVPSYGELSRMPLDALQSAEGKIRDDKRDPADFALWKAAKPGEPSWESPWGTGRPGWHIECSAMAEKYLGAQFDIHGGGIDLMFPHHECERAQSHGIHGPDSSAGIWMHNGFVGFRWVHEDKVLAEGSKISKSDEKMRFMYRAFVARNAIRCHGGEAVRLWLMSTHYRNPIAFDVDMPPGDTRDLSKMRLPGLETAERSLEYTYMTLQRLDRAILAASLGRPGRCRFAKRRVSEPAAPIWANIWAAQLLGSLDDDFNTAEALASWFMGLAGVNRLLDAPDNKNGALLQRIRDDFTRVAASLGIGEQDPGTWLTAHWRRRAAAAGVDLDRVAELVSARAIARAARDYATSDRLRAELMAMKIEALDSPSGTTWRVADSSGSPDPGPGAS